MTAVSPLSTKAVWVITLVAANFKTKRRTFQRRVRAGRIKLGCGEGADPPCYKCTFRKTLKSALKTKNFEPAKYPQPFLPLTFSQSPNTLQKKKFPPSLDKETSQKSNLFKVASALDIMSKTSFHAPRLLPQGTSLTHQPLSAPSLGRDRLTGQSPTGPRSLASWSCGADLPGQVRKEGPATALSQCSHRHSHPVAPLLSSLPAILTT